MDVLQFSWMCWNHLDVGSNPFQCSWLFEIWCNMAFHVASFSPFTSLLGGIRVPQLHPAVGCFENLSLKIDMATQRWRFERCYFPYSIGWNISVPAINFGGKKTPSYHPPLRSWRIFNHHPHLEGIRVSSIGGASEATLWWGTVATGHCPTLAEGAKWDPQILGKILVVTVAGFREHPNIKPDVYIKYM